MGTGDLSRHERRSRATRKRLYDVAIDLFRERGFDHVAVEEVTERADVGKGTFFHHFPSKELVLLEHYREVSRRLLAYAEGLEADTCRAWFRRLFRWMEEFVRDEEQLVDQVVRHVFSRPELMRAENEVGRRMLKRYQTVIEDGTARGELRTDLNVRLAARLVANLWSATLFEWLYNERSFSIAAELERKLEVLFDGLRVPDGRASAGSSTPAGRLETGERSRARRADGTGS